MSKEYRPYTEDQIAEAVARMLRGERVTHVARDMGVPKSTVVEWKKKYLGTRTERMTQAFEDRLNLAIEKNLMELIEASTFITATLLTDAEWLKNQDAKNIASILNALTNKEIQVLRAIERQAEFRHKDESEGEEFDTDD